MKIKIKRIDKDLPLPAYTKDLDAALDLRSAEEGIISPGETRTFRTGMIFAIPKGYVGLVWDRSGMAAKHSIHTMAGVLDAGYRGELILVLKNLGEHDFRVERGMRIAQLVVQPVLNADVVEVDELDDTQRGENRFSSTGLR